MRAVSPELPSATKLVEEFAKSEFSWRTALSFRTRWQRWAFGIMVGAFLAGLVALAVAFATKHPWALLVLTLLLATTLVAGIVFQVTMLLPDAWSALRAPVRSALAPCLDRASSGSGRAVRLSQCPTWELEFLEEHLRLEATQLRTRWSVMLGPIETLGLLPAMAAGVLALHSLKSAWDSPAAPPWFEAVVMALIGLYLAAFFGVSGVQLMEQYAQLLRMARKLKDERKGDHR